MEIVGNHSDLQTKQMVVDAFVDERRELRRLAKLHLSRNEIIQLKLNSQGALSFQAGKAYQLLQQKGVYLDSMHDEDIPGWLIYASIGVNRDMADMLWSSGFQEIDEVDCDGFTSLMLCQSLDFAEWLITHGADIHRKRKGSPALHYLIENHLHSSSIIDSDFMLGDASLRCASLI